MKKNRLIALASVGIVALATPAQASLIFAFEVTEVGHLLEGATVTSTATGNFVWESPTGFADGAQFAAVNAPWSTTISGATGAGAGWNGNYTFGGTAYAPNVGIILPSRGGLKAPTGFRSDGFLANEADWSNGSNSFRFRLRTGVHDVFPSTDDGAPVDFSGVTFSLDYLESLSGTLPAFAEPTAGNASGAVIPEPSSALLLGLGAIALTAFRRRRPK